MNTLDLIIARTNLSITIEKMRNSLIDIKDKHPGRTDLIKSMEKSISDLTFSYVFFCELEAEYRTAKQISGNLEFCRFKDREELEKQRIEIQNLKNSISDFTTAP